MSRWEELRCQHPFATALPKPGQLHVSVKMLLHPESGTEGPSLGDFSRRAFAALVSRGDDDQQPADMVVPYASAVGMIEAFYQYNAKMYGSSQHPFDMDALSNRLPAGGGRECRTLRQEEFEEFYVASLRILEEDFPDSSVQRNNFTPRVPEFETKDMLLARIAQPAAWCGGFQGAPTWKNCSEVLLSDRDVVLALIRLPTTIAELTELYLKLPKTLQRDKEIACAALESGVAYESVAGNFTLRDEHTAACLSTAAGRRGMTVIVCDASGEELWRGVLFASGFYPSALKKTVAEATAFGREYIQIVFDGDLLESDNWVDFPDNGTVQIEAVLTERPADGPTRREVLVSLGQFDAARCDLQAEMEAHGKTRCSYKCSYLSGQLGLLREGVRCRSPDDNPYGPCSDCRSGRTQDRIEATRCPEAGALNMAMAELKVAIKREQEAQRTRAKEKKARDGLKS
eukprot:TRINITY_DN30083_c0_g1_i3.p1 TRINITY_DN30083_c0_g1~~TRINITY_DN30083_c0_g1_i3.p1  ORF type:complete len:458 (-),score=60.38 TRINITY_DN30083_c0_g1_i3:256-1629(-)